MRDIGGETKVEGVEGCGNPALGIRVHVRHKCSVPQTPHEITLGVSGGKVIFICAMEYLDEGTRI